MNKNTSEYNITDIAIKILTMYNRFENELFRTTHKAEMNVMT